MGVMLCITPFLSESNTMALNTFNRRPIYQRWFSYALFLAITLGVVGVGLIHIQHRYFGAALITAAIAELVVTFGWTVIHDRPNPAPALVRYYKTLQIVSLVMLGGSVYFDDTQHSIISASGCGYAVGLIIGSILWRHVTKKTFGI